jgi:hypothetical protein
MAEQEVVDWIPEESEPRPPITTLTWDGTRTRLRVARNVWRGDHDAQGNALRPHLVGRNETIEFEAAYDKGTKTWVGPEADHVQNLIRIGAIAGTSRAAELDAMIRNAEVERGAWGGGENVEPLRPDLRQRTRDELYQLLIRAGGRSYVEGSVDERLRIDRQEARRSEEQTGAIRELAQAIREGGNKTSFEDAVATLSPEQVETLARALAQRTSQPMDNEGEWPGAQGPGTHPSARARRNRKEDVVPPPIESD